MNLLCIVDMQEGFDAARTPGLVCRISDLAREFRTRDEPVVVLEYEDSGPTLAPIKDALLGYWKVRFATKKGGDGSKEVKKACDSAGWSPNKISICGVEAGACVVQTFEGLWRLMRGIKLEVVPDGVGEQWKWPLDRWHFNKIFNEKVFLQ